MLGAKVPIWHLGRSGHVTPPNIMERDVRDPRFEVTDRAILRLEVPFWHLKR